MRIAIAASAASASLKLVPLLVLCAVLFVGCKRQVIVGSVSTDGKMRLYDSRTVCKETTDTERTGLLLCDLDTDEPPAAAPAAAPASSPAPSPAPAEAPAAIQTPPVQAQALMQKKLRVFWPRPQPAGGSGNVPNGVWPGDNMACGDKVVPCVQITAKNGTIIVDCTTCP